MSFGVALRNAVAIGLGGIASLLSGRALSTSIQYGRLTESLAFRALESLDIRLLEFSTPAMIPVVGGRIGIDFTIGTSALA